jgi:two-component system cell cycle sensor histidine kinase/response regulator CckA
LAGNLTRQLLAFARRQVLQPKEIDLNSAISRISSFLQSAVGENFDFRIILDPGVRPIAADPTQIEQVLMNLGLNARDAMPQGGSLVVETNNVDLDDEFCRLHSYGRPGSYVLLTVSDTGLGMDAATQEHIFEPFFTTKELGKGTGLGLATVYGIVKQHGGFINVHSEVGRGTTFRIYFPTISGQQEPKSQRVIPRSTSGTETILVAEDNAALRALVEEVLGSQGYTVVPASDGVKAVRLFSQNPDSFALVVLDVVMPKLGDQKRSHEGPPYDLTFR